jgi:hypothetical protein
VEPAPGPPASREYAAPTADDPPGAKNGGITEDVTGKVTGGVTRGRSAPGWPPSAAARALVGRVSTGLGGRRPPCQRALVEEPDAGIGHGAVVKDQVAARQQGVQEPFENHSAIRPDAVGQMLLFRLRLISAESRGALTRRTSHHRFSGCQLVLAKSEKAPVGTVRASYSCDTNNYSKCPLAYRWTARPSADPALCVPPDLRLGAYRAN